MDMTNNRNPLKACFLDFPFSILVENVKDEEENLSFSVSRWSLHTKLYLEQMIDHLLFLSGGHLEKNSEKFVLKSVDIMNVYEDKKILVCSLVKQSSCERSHSLMSRLRENFTGLRRLSEKQFH